MKKIQCILIVACSLFIALKHAAAVDYLVHGAGTTAVNGIYLQGASTLSDDGSGKYKYVYELSDTNNNVVFELRYLGCARDWLIVPPNEHQHGHYYATAEHVVTPDFYLLPDALPHSWYTHHLGVDPPPTVSPITRAFNDELLLTAAGPADIERTEFSATWYVETTSGLNLVYHIDVATDSQFANLIQNYGGLDVTTQTLDGSLSSIAVSGLSPNTEYHFRISAYPPGSPGSVVRSNAVKVRTIPEGYHVSGAGTSQVNGDYRYSGEYYNGRPVFKKYSVPYILGYCGSLTDNRFEDEYMFFAGSQNSTLDDYSNCFYRDEDRGRGFLLPPDLYTACIDGTDPPPVITPFQAFTAQPATLIGSTSFTANWDTMQAAAGYYLDVALDAGFANFLPGYNGLTAGNVTNHTVSGLSANTRYYYRVRAYYSDGGPDSANTNTIDVATLASQPSAQPFSNVEVNSIQANWGSSGNPSGTQYQCENVTTGADSGWITETYWNNTAIRCGTSFFYRVRARNMEGVMTGWTDLSSQETLDCPPLTVEPSEGLTAGGGLAGPFNPSDQAYTLQHSSATAMDWSVNLVNNHDWVGLSQTQGTLDPGQTAGVTVSINSNAHSLPIGTYSETVIFFMDGVEQQSRPVNLTVLAAYNLLATVSPQGAGTISLDPSGGTYLDGTQVSLEAVAVDPFYAFDHWDGDLSGSGNLASILMDADKTVTAGFTLKDSDGDGITDQEEASGPNGGDENNDTIPDYQQPNVASLKGQDGQTYVVIVSESGTTLQACASIPNPHPADCPDWVNFEFGFFRFAIAGVTPGGSTSVTITLAAGAAPNAYYKYGPVPGDPVSQWYRFKYEQTTGLGVEFNDNVITVHFTDGGLGDDDLAADGIIHDDGGPGVMIGGSGNNSPAATPSGSGGGGGGGGCLIEAVLPGGGG